MTDYIRDPNDLNSTTDDDLPGMWSHSDFEGGDPDERSYAQREEDREPLNYSEAKFGQFEVADLRPIQDAINRDIARLAAISVGYALPFDPPTPILDAFEAEPVGYDGFGAPIYEHQISVDWREPVTMTLELRDVDMETIMLACGVDFRRPLCEHSIEDDGRGTE